jgi:hypothetical protein
MRPSAKRAPIPQREGAADCFRTYGRRRYRPEQSKIRLRVGFRRKRRAIEAKGFDGKGLGDHGFLRQDVAAACAPVGFGPHSVAMEERRAVAQAQSHRRHLEPRDPGWSESVAVERRVRGAFGERRHHIGKRAKQTLLHVQDAAGKSGRGKSPARGLQQRQARFQREAEGAAARLYPLDALGHGRAGLNDAPHRQRVGSEARSINPRASSSSRTSRFGTLP